MIALIRCLPLPFGYVPPEKSPQPRHQLRVHLIDLIAPAFIVVLAAFFIITAICGGGSLREK